MKVNTLNEGVMKLPKGLNADKPWLVVGTDVMGNSFRRGPFKKRKAAIKDFCRTYWHGFSKQEKVQHQLEALLAGEAVTFTNSECLGSTGEGTPDVLRLAELKVRADQTKSGRYFTGDDSVLGAVYQLSKGEVSKPAPKTSEYAISNEEKFEGFFLLMEQMLEDYHCDMNVDTDDLCYKWMLLKDDVGEENIPRKLTAAFNETLEDLEAGVDMASFYDPDCATEGLGTYLYDGVYVDEDGNMTDTSRGSR